MFIWARFHTKKKKIHNLNETFKNKNKLIFYSNLNVNLSQEVLGKTISTKFLKKCANCERLQHLKIISDNSSLFLYNLALSPYTLCLLVLPVSKSTEQNSQQIRVFHDTPKLSHQQFIYISYSSHFHHAFMIYFAKLKKDTMTLKHDTLDYLV